MDFQFTRTLPAISILVVVIVLIGPVYATKVYAQENSTMVLDNIRSQLRDDRIDLSEIKNMTARETAILSEINLTSTKLATQGAYTAISVFFLGISLVIFGLRLTMKGLAHMGKYFTMMVWALTIPVIILISVFQVAKLTNFQFSFADTEEPFLLLSFLLYVPIGIIVFLLLVQKKITQGLEVTDDPERRKL